MMYADEIDPRPYTIHSFLQRRVKICRRPSSRTLSLRDVGFNRATVNHLKSFLIDGGQ
jgi:hypothetical protein